VKGRGAKVEGSRGGPGGKNEEICRESGGHQGVKALIDENERANRGGRKRLQGEKRESAIINQTNDWGLKMSRFKKGKPMSGEPKSRKDIRRVQATRAIKVGSIYGGGA